MTFAEAEDILRNPIDKTYDQIIQASMVIVKPVYEGKAK